MSTDRPTEPRAVPAAYRFLKPPEHPDEIGRLGDYRVLELLGSGGMAFVFLAEDPALQRRVALKVIKPALADDPAICQRFLREARALASINHENVVAVHQVGHDGNTLFLAMEWLRGQTLEDRVTQSGPPVAAEILRIARETAAGLAAIHEQGLVHRDLKPNNLWLETVPSGVWAVNKEVAAVGNAVTDAVANRVKILDFGLVRPVEDDVRYTASGLIVGTPAFMSPEQARGDHIDQRSDLFSLGCVLYFLCTGDLPFRAGTSVGMLTAVALDTPRPIRDANPEIRPAVEALVMRLLEKEPAHRPASAREVIDLIGELEACPSQQPTERIVKSVPPATNIGGPTAEMTPPPRTSRRRRRLVPAVLTIAGCLLAAAGMYFGFPAKDGSAARADRPNDSVQQEPEGVLVLDDCDDRPGSEGDNLSCLDANGGLKFRVSGFNTTQTVASAHLIAVDRARGHIWVLENAACRLRRFDSEGNETLRITDVDGSSIAVDPETGNVWALAGGKAVTKSVVVYDVSGQLIRRHDAFGFDIAYDPFAKAFWVVGARVTKLAAATGKVQFTFQISNWFAATVAVDARDGSAWVASRGLDELDGDKDRLLKFGADGQKIVSIDLKRKMPFHVSVDAADGSVWVACHLTAVEHYSADGHLLGELPIAASTVQSGDRGDVWVVTPAAIQRLNSGGDLISKAIHVRRTGQAWVAPLK